MRIAGIDYGSVRIGIATADSSVGIAGPYATYSRRDEATDAKFFQRLVEEEGIDRFVVGLPAHLSGLESRKSAEARQFGAWLTEKTDVPVEFFDERFTTVEADELLELANLTRKQRTARRDQLAAQIMLTAYLESGSRGQDQLQPIDDE